MLVMCVLRPRGAPVRGHLCTDDAVKILGEVKPSLCVMTGFGIRMIYANPDLEAQFIHEVSGVKTIAARDNMRLKLDERREQRSLRMFLE
ncbi:hypothetical protein KEJ39_02795 [Candidatus Bathyarchaeota archaeon]|nr:hypothetical protein [Candidatus Bathyarchaeota archaeon]